MKAPRCQICGRPQAPEYRPFCSGRCADVDLQRWLSGGYAIPAAKGDEDDSADRAADDEG
ncbi:MAG TPA: DNA gyrase inhibitor YacG [Caulobacteraceae bacterium]